MAVQGSKQEYQTRKQYFFQHISKSDFDKF